MEIKKAVDNVLSQLQDVVGQVNDSDFRKPVDILGGATLGQHIRHTLEFFICLMEGHKSGIVNYENRSHDSQIENDKILTMDLLGRIKDFVLASPNDKSFILEASYDPFSSQNDHVETTYRRELVYNIEHTIHHMAIIKIGIKAICPYINLPESFGVAVSTLKYKAGFQNS